jgi:hypothetical protein
MGGDALDDADESDDEGMHAQFHFCGWSLCVFVSCTWYLVIINYAWFLQLGVAIN